MVPGHTKQIRSQLCTLRLLCHPYHQGELQGLAISGIGCFCGGDRHNNGWPAGGAGMIGPLKALLCSQLTFPPHSIVTLPPHSIVTLPPHSIVTLPPHSIVTLPPHSIVTLPPQNIFYLLTPFSMYITSRPSSSSPPSLPRPSLILPSHSHSSSPPTLTHPPFSSYPLLSLTLPSHLPLSLSLTPPSSSPPTRPHPPSPLPLSLTPLSSHSLLSPASTSC